MKRLLLILLSLVMFIPCISNVYALNEEFTNAEIMYTSGTYKGDIPQGETKYYKFYLAESGTFVFDYTFESHRYSRLRLYDANGDELMRDDAISTNAAGLAKETLELPLMSGVYYIAIVNTGKDGKYSVKTSFESAKESFKETMSDNNNILSNSDKVEIEKTYKGFTGIEDEKDFYRFNLDTNMSMNFKYDVYYSSGRVFLFDAEGNEIYKSSSYRFDKDIGKYTGEFNKDLTKGVYYLMFESGSDYRYYCGKYNFKITRNVPFTDVYKTDWYHGSVADVYYSGLMTGATETLFKPNANMNRGMVAIVFHRMEGSKKVAYSKVFPDVANNQYYTTSVLWAKQTGVINGYTDGTFKPLRNVSREEMATMIYNFAKYKKLNMKASKDITGYKDYAKITPYARVTLQWAIENGIMSGKDNGTRLDPLGNATRGECAKMLYQLSKLLK